MATTALTLPSTHANTLTHTLRLYARETRFELIRSLRNRVFAFSIIGFPTMFYLLFGVVNKGQTMQHGTNVAKYLLGGYSAFGIVGAALFGIGVGLAMDRSAGWLELKRASPMPPLAYLVARCIMAVVFSLLIVNVLCAIGVTMAGVHLTASEYIRLQLITVLGSVPFAGLGLLLASVLPANAAPGIVNMIYLPMSYCSGLWIPVFMLPRWLQHLAPWLPTYHLSQLMLGALGYAQRGESMIQHVVALAAFTLIFLGVASVAFRRMDGEA